MPVDPSAGRRSPRRPGRPPRTSLDALAEAAVDLGLDTFTVAAVAQRVGVGESTVYSYCGSRDGLFTAAAARVFARLDTDVDAAGWAELVEVVAQRTTALAVRHPGLGDYVLRGPYAPGTVEIFESLVARVQAWLPGAPDHVAWVLASRPVVLSLAYLGDPVLEPMIPWLRRALLRGLDEMVGTGSYPAAPPVSWQTKLRSPPGAPGAPG